MMASYWQRRVASIAHAIVNASTGATICSIASWNNYRYQKQRALVLSAKRYARTFNTPITCMRCKAMMVYTLA